MKKILSTMLLALASISLFAQEAAATATEATAQKAASPAGGYGGIFMMVAMFAVVYFLMIRPQKKQQQKMRDMLDNLNLKDEIVTAGGIVGRIVNFNKDKDIVVIQVDESVKLKIKRASIAGVVSEKAPQEKA